MFWEVGRLAPHGKRKHISGISSFNIDRRNKVSWSSGTTYIWSDYLAKVSEEWDKEVGFGTLVPWPAGVGGQGNAGVAGLVKAAPYSIGYVELAYAIKNKLPYGWVKKSSRQLRQSGPGIGNCGRRRSC